MQPDLSIIIPTLNEEDALPLLLADLACQQEILLEVIVSDGKSVDATCRIADEFFTSGRLKGVCLSGPSGRGRQLNAGAMAANSEWLLFLHADSSLTDAKQLRRALDSICRHQHRENSDASAGRFSLRFDTTDSDNGVGLFYYEVKAKLGRPGCIHGDQGFLLRRSFFQQIGPFREDLPVMEDTLLAETIRTRGQWLLLPGEILTSARRFKIEGLRPRQTLNALMMNFLSIGWLEFFAEAPELYRRQDQTQPLQLLPFFLLIRDLLNQKPFRSRCAIWLATGSYVRSQAWQIGLAWDCKKAYREKGIDVRPADRWLKWFDRWFDTLTNNLVGRTITALLVRAWFSWQINHQVDHQTP
jgi:rSAM/selenodomain-associated transferase 2